MDLQERLQLDAARLQAAKVKARTRPWRYIFAIILAVIAAVVSVQARYVATELSNPLGHSKSVLAPLGYTGNTGLSYGAAIAFCLLAGAGTLGLGNKARKVLERSVGSAHAAVVRFAILVIGGLATVIFTLELFDIAVTQLIVGGAVTGVLVGIAAQQSLANVFAGIVLLMARPFRVGDQIGIRSGALSGLIEGTVSEISITYVRMETASGPIHIPNSQVLAAAVGPVGAVPVPGGAGTPPPAPAAAAPPAPGTAAGAGTAAPPAAQATAEKAAAPAEEHVTAGIPPGSPGAPAAAPGPAKPESAGPEPERNTGSPPS